MKKGKFKIILLIVIALVFISSGFIYLGITLNKKSEPLVVTKTLLEEVFPKITRFFAFSDLANSDSFSCNFDIKIENNTSNATSLTANYKLLRNITAKITPYEANISFLQDEKEKCALLEAKENLSNGPLNSRLLIENATNYYKVEDYTETYINNGSSNYFENASSKNIFDNINYLMELYFNSFIANLKEEYFTKYPTTTIVNEKEEKVNRISLKLTNDILEKIQKDIYRDLKKNIVFTSLFSNTSFFSLEDNASITLNIYVDRVFSKIRKIELVNLIGEDESKISYEANDKMLLYIVNNDKIEEYIKVKNKEITIYDANNKSIGQVAIKNTKSKAINIYLNDLDNYFEFVYESQSDKNENRKLLSLNLRVKNIDIINFLFNVNSECTKKANIIENTEDSILQSSLDKDIRDKLNNIKDSRFLRLID